MNELTHLSYQPATSEDEPFLRGLFMREKALQFSALPLAPEQLESLLDMQYRAQTQQYAATYPHANSRLILVEGTPVGTVLTHGDEEIQLVNIVILPEYQNKGVGTRVLRDLISYGKPIHLSVDPNNPALRLYTKLGFVVVGQQSLHLEMTYRPSM